MPEKRRAELAKYRYEKASEQVDNADKFLKMVKLHLDERDGNASEAVS